MKDTPLSQTMVGAILIAVVAVVVGVVLETYLNNRGGALVQSPAVHADRTAPPASGSTPTVPTPPGGKAVEVGGDGSVRWRSPADGVVVSWGADGAVQGVTSRATVAVSSGDAAAVSNALVIAEERAKAAIVRFMQESVSSERVISQVTSDLHALDGTGIDRRALVTTFREVTRSFASGQLSGVVLLERDFDAIQKLAWVVVGIDARSLGASKALRQMMGQ